MALSYSKKVTMSMRFFSMEKNFSAFRAPIDGYHGGMELYTIGHSTRSYEEFVRLLKASGVRRLADIRSVPRSRHNPQFEQNELIRALPKDGIEYIHLKALGGLRPVKKDSVNAGWQNASFRGYADYMQTEAFEEGLDRLISLADEAPTCIMCAEALPWRCHRSLVADALTARGIRVRHIMGEGRTQDHDMTGFARVEGGRVSYPAEEKHD